jgi:hypothetical protein
MNLQERRFQNINGKNSLAIATNKITLPANRVLPDNKKPMLQEYTFEANDKAE